MPEDLFYYAAKVPVRLRVVINTLHTLKYTVMLAELARIPVPSDTWQVVYDVDALRQKWWDFGEEKYKRLKNLCISACKVLQHILDNCVSLCQEICPTQSFDYSSVLDNGFIQKYSEKALSHYYETGVPLKMVHPGLIKVLSLYKELEPKLTPTLEKYGKLPKIQIKNNSIYMKGINKHVKEMTRYGDVMIPLGIPATKYYSLGYSPQNTKRTQSRQVAVMKKGKHFLKRLCQPTFYLRILDHLLSKAGI